MRLKSHIASSLYKDFHGDEDDDNSSDSQETEGIRRLGNYIDRRSLRALQKRIQSIKMTVLILIPCIGLAAITVSSLVNNTFQQNQANQVKKEISSSIQLGDLIHRLQIERGQTVLYVSSNYDRNMFKSLIQERLETNRAIDKIQPWPTVELHSLNEKASYLANRSAIYEYLNYHRDKVVDIANTTAMNELIFYSNINSHLLGWISTGIRNVQTDSLWNVLVAYQMLLKGKEETGFERAVGSIYFLRTNLSYREALLYYAKLQLGNMSLTSAVQYSNYIALHFNETVSNASINQRLQSLRSIITENIPHKPSIEQANDWFAYMSAYINQLKIIQDRTALYIQSQSTKISEVAAQNFILSLILLMSVLFICPVLIFLTVKLTKSIQTYAVNLATKTKKLKREKIKTDALLCEMLPKSIAERLKRGQDIVAEKYDNVTIYFSDIVGFEQICHQCSAMDIVDMLNNIYLLFDVQTDKHEVYKVETIGDAYMVVSGLPKKLPDDRHAVEITEMALDMLNSIKKVKLPQNPNTQIQLRAGIHSGSCAAGVIGRKMPRYCLFGDAVNIASRMESSGEASKIHCSEATYRKLVQTYQYRLIERGEVNIKGIGNMRTYWIIGKMITLNSFNI
ncbi:uncharacterized protein TRIADDRAFT_29434 [Trichoplax adhaerens]|uniref:guanylate cyclase n=1 Tax=Trichoplax adhaerens TaxID=10228 RepID=B3S514_TRIAD|nr:hypothetical protein TRIADDRAFT_29434 [Trichoplax adhaerens]EDV22186.1 hypothetical protein TRIADDRAFT_29434 [Trichoplax adhaerens]|eukprot:XP_002115341.1 hypothetical protein TRIADDRAFT_29434 [Trichoplax adhaerens]